MFDKIVGKLTDDLMYGSKQHENTESRTRKYILKLMFRSKNTFNHIFGKENHENIASHS